jgi:hypothetical protein
VADRLTPILDASFQVEVERFGPAIGGLERPEIANGRLSRKSAVISRATASIRASLGSVIARIQCESPGVKFFALATSSRSSCPPTSTMIGATRLSHPDFLIEIDLVAITEA